VRVFQQAEKIASYSLRLCYSKNGIFAGRRHYDDYWARDAFFASFGACRLRDFQLIRKMLAMFAYFQKKNGQIPLRIGDCNIILKFLGIKKHKKRLNAVYTQDKGLNVPVDQNSLFVIAAHNYIKKSNDINFAKHYLKNLEKAIRWNFFNSKKLLVQEKHFGNWNDSIKKKGAVLYSNICNYYSVYCLSEICRLLKLDKKTKIYFALSKVIKKIINENFWNGLFYSDWIHKNKKYNYFSVDGNILAILWDVADKQKAKSILSVLKRTKLEHPVPCRTNYPRYPWYRTSFMLRLVNMHDYHNKSQAWLWLGAITAMAKLKIGYKKEARETLERLAHIIIRDKIVYEVYENDGSIVNRSLYKSERPFAWSAGLFLEALSVYRSNYRF